jgi:hypothetical protein
MAAGKQLRRVVLYGGLFEDRADEDIVELVLGAEFDFTGQLTLILVVFFYYTTNFRELWDCKSSSFDQLLQRRVFIHVVVDAVLPRESISQLQEVALIKERVISSNPNLLSLLVKG